ncbi:hypothetical protein MPDQ_007738 [Monascus purpureus]|uniref:Lethal giant larvae (Lgl)-like C-terminal domain-containing protein n=1 Tax=Monascus purpureus TaxID=5098 RepID=A0A507QTA3_MONPU|nr:hypothetical protein MPDQ_007738 [Monascus purpureus]BDD57006.1 hypothetical protein MAP00_002415 [Monascus purpureus]
MAHFLRGKQAGVANDLSEGLSSDQFILDGLARYGINSQISAIAYDPVQSLLAVGTSDTQYGNGQIYVFGQRRVCVTLNFPRKTSARFLAFSASKLVCIDSKHDINIFSLETNKLLLSHAPHNFVTSFTTDPSLDYAFIGLQNGDIIAFDLDRESVTPFRIPNLWTERNPRARQSPVVSLAFSPRDIGKLVVGYPEGAVVFSFKQNIAQKYFVYEVPPGALGGNSTSPSAELRRPKLTKALWHPNGIFILTVHDDTSLVLWDGKDGRKIMARTIEAANVDQLSTGPERPSSLSSTDIKNPIIQAAWCVKANTDDTGLLIAGGNSAKMGKKALTFLDWGSTPNYQTSSWQMLSRYFEVPKQQICLQTPPGADVVDFCLIPRSSPYYAGAHDPIAVLALLSSGELATLSFPSGYPISPTNMLHVSLSFVHPFVNKVTLTPVERGAWLGLKERRAQGPKFLEGGISAKKLPKRFEDRNIVGTAHGDGTIRLWDAGHNDEIENPDVIQVDLARAVGRAGHIEVTEMSMSGATGELSVGLRTGEVVIFRWGTNGSFGHDESPGENGGPGTLTKILHRADPGLKQGLIPLTLLEMQSGPVTAIKNSDVGFVAAGFEGGSLAIIDLRGPAIIYTTHISDFIKSTKRGSFRRSRQSEESRSEWPTSIEFGVLTLEGKSYSSICCFVGTNRGNLATFEILPSGNGAYTASFAGAVSVDDKVVSICPINTDTGNLALATPNTVGGLREGLKFNGVIVAVTISGCRIFKPATAKGASKTWDDYLCDAASVVKPDDKGCSLVGLFGDGNIRAFSIPSLKEIGCSKISHIFDMRRLSSSIISPAGIVLSWLGPSEVGLFNVWGAGIELPSSEDKLFNEQAVAPPRPTISNVEWISGTQYVSPADMDILIGGPDRPPSKRMVEQMRLEEQERRKASREQRQIPGQSSSRADEGYWAGLQRQVQERTERLGFTGDTMDRLEENSSNFANDVDKFISAQKRKMALGLIGSKLGF